MNIRHGPVMTYYRLPIRLIVRLNKASTPNPIDKSEEQVDTGAEQTAEQTAVLATFIRDGMTVHMPHADDAVLCIQVMGIKESRKHLMRRRGDDGLHSWLRFRWKCSCAKSSFEEQRQRHLLAVQDFYLF